MGMSRGRTKRKKCIDIGFHLKNPLEGYPCRTSTSAGRSTTCAAFWTAAADTMEHRRREVCTIQRHRSPHVHLGGTANDGSVRRSSGAPVLDPESRWGLWQRSPAACCFLCLAFFLRDEIMNDGNHNRQRSNQSTNDDDRYQHPSPCNWSKGPPRLAAGVRLDDYSVRVINDDFNFIPFARPFDRGLMYTPRTEQKYDKTESYRNCNFNTTSHSAGLRTGEKPCGD
jgi:hypothetical protein